MMIKSKQAARRKIEDASGASIVIALVFFLICALIGSMILTTASVNTRTTFDYKESRQSEYTVSSAAQLVGQQLQKDTTLTWDWTGTSAANRPTLSVSAPSGSFAEQLWSNYRNDVWTYWPAPIFCTNQNVSF